MHKLILYSSFIGQESVILPTCQSTNQIAREICEKETPKEGTVVLTFDQTAGKGQRGNSWQSEPHKNLTVSVILKPTFLDLSRQFYLNILTSLAVYDFLSPFLDEYNLKVKWPNDILYTEKKICGILIENIIRGNQLEYSVIGIGVNINQEKFNYPQASSLKSFTNQEYDLYEMTSQLLKKLEDQYLLLKEGKFEELKSSYIQKLFQYGQDAIYQDTKDQPFEGQIVGLQEDGRLVLVIGQEVKAFDFKEIKFLY